MPGLRLELLSSAQKRPTKAGVCGILSKCMDMNPPDWNLAIASLPDAHILQTWEWAQIKGEVGWQAVPRLWAADGSPLELQGQANLAVSAAAMVLRRRLPIGGFSARLQILYAPKGPLLDWSNVSLRRQVLDDLYVLARRSDAIFIKIDPNVLLGRGVTGGPGAEDDRTGLDVLSDLKARGWLSSPEQIQFRNTVWVDLDGTEDDLLARMKQKTRYNIRLAERKGVKIRLGSEADFDMLYRMYAETSLRDGFVIRDETYYTRVWKIFMDNLCEKAGIPGPAAQPLIAEVEGEAVAAVIPVRFAGSAWYLYGMSRAVHREKMPNYLLQWEAMRWAKQSGCRLYDLWGAPDDFSEKDPMWGVYRFKEGLGGNVARTIGAWDLPVKPLFYRLYTQTLPRILGVMRYRGKQRTRQLLSV
jgi:peptidoglycan pentaglycine glycine transferase (the first glycine)